MKFFKYTFCLLTRLAQASDYRCIFGPDADGIYVEEMVGTQVA